MRSSDPQAVLFDMDGTLVDTEPAWFATETSVMADLGYRLGPQHRAHLLGSPMQRAVAYLIGVSGLAVTPAELEERINTRMVETLRGGVELRPGARELLHELAAAGVPMALVTASHREIVDAVLPSIGAHLFRTTVAGDELPRTKPFPDPYLTAARRLGARPLDCVAVEDSPTGIASATAAGCLVVGVPSAAPLQPGPRLVVVDSLKDVDLGYLESLAAQEALRSA